MRRVADHLVMMVGNKNWRCWDNLHQLLARDKCVLGILLGRGGLYIGSCGVESNPAAKDA